MPRANYIATAKQLVRNCKKFSLLQFSDDAEAQKLFKSSFKNADYIIALKHPDSLFTFYSCVYVTYSDLNCYNDWKKIKGGNYTGSGREYIKRRSSEESSFLRHVFAKNSSNQYKKIYEEYKNFLLCQNIVRAKGKSIKFFIVNTEDNFPEKQQSRNLENLAEKGSLPETDRTILIKARIQQGAYRAKLDKIWNNQCAVTGIGIRQVLRASHIKPYRNCKKKEKIDPNNGLLLQANLDALFDRGLISFNKKGNILLSDVLKNDAAPIGKLGLKQLQIKSPLNEEQRRYLAYHRKIHKFKE